MASQETRFCLAEDGTRIAYAVDGEGPPLVFVGPWTYSLDYRGHRELNGLREQLSLHRSVVNFDRRGIGASQREIGEVSLDAALADVDAVAAAARLIRFDMVGMYGGANVAAAYSVRNPEKVRRLVLVGLTKSIAEGYLAVVQGIVDFIDANWEGAKLAMVAWMFRGAPGELTQGSLEIFDKAVSADVAKKYMRLAASIDSIDVLPSISAPTLVVHWRQDPNLRLEDSRSAAALVPGSTFLVIDSTEHPLVGSDTIVRPILEFLREGDAADRPSGLTERETEILALLASGRSNQDIANELSISVRTAERHIGNIYMKIDASNRAEATAFAYRLGIVPPTRDT